MLYHGIMTSAPDNRHQADLYRDARIADWKHKARQAARKKHQRNLYVITLHPDVMTHKEFCTKNPGYIEGMPCVYVGMTIHDPGDRYEQHKLGYRSSKYPRRFGIELAPELINGFDEDGLPEDEKEAALANWLRDQGYGVWQN